MKINILIAILTITISSSIGANPMSNIMEMYPSAQRNAALTELLNDGNKQCNKVTVTFLQGFDKRDNAYWNALCDDGTKYVIQVAPDANGATKAMLCSKIEQISGVKCFTKFK